ncbi:MAG: hypothetical protein IKU64_05650 [Bacteroides sp.]|nr:hypothetical protein [Bacteroides sp.]
MEDYKQAIIDSLQIKVGDWTFGDVGDGFGQIIQIAPFFYEEYDNHIPKGKSVGDYEGCCMGIVKYFCTEEILFRAV